MRPVPLPAGPGQESVWSYPRPPRLEPNARHLVVRFAGATIAETRAGFRVLETSHPPVYYFPPADVDARCLLPSSRGSFCEYKGAAAYHSIRALDGSPALARDAAWYYPRPSPGFAALAGCIAFYPAAMEACLVDGERVRPQPGGFYGGWITSDIVGPFKGEPGTSGW